MKQQWQLRKRATIDLACTTAGYRPLLLLQYSYNRACKRASKAAKTTRCGLHSSYTAISRDLCFETAVPTIFSETPTTPTSTPDPRTPRPYLETQHSSRNHSRTPHLCRHAFLDTSRLFKTFTSPKSPNSTAPTPNITLPHRCHNQPRCVKSSTRCTRATTGWHSRRRATGLRYGYASTRRKCGSACRVRRLNTRSPLGARDCATSVSGRRLRNKVGKDTIGHRRKMENRKLESWETLTGVLGG